MGVLLPNYPEENVVKGESVPNFKMNTSKGASSNVFQILQDLQLKQYEGPTIPVPYPVPHLNSTKNSTIPVPCMSTQENPATRYRTGYRTQHN